MKRNKTDRLFDLAGALQEFSGRLGLDDGSRRMLEERVQMLRAQLVNGAGVREAKPLLIELRGILTGGSGDLARGAAEEIDEILS
jgi:hypothetical protein